MKSFSEDIKEVRDQSFKKITEQEDGVKGLIMTLSKKELAIEGSGPIVKLINENRCLLKNFLVEGGVIKKELPKIIGLKLDST